MRLSVLDVLDERFPGQGVILRRLLERDHELRGLCEDLAVSVAAMRRWRLSGVPNAQIRAEEYRLLADELTQEIATFLERQP